MATKKQFTMSVSERSNRRFSEGFRREKVKELEAGHVRIRDLVRQYEVSEMTVRRWILKFGSQKSKKERIIVESKSDTIQLIELRKKIAELERVIGQKQLLIDFQQKMIELAEQEYRIDIKKNFSGGPSNTTGKTGQK